MLKKTIYRANRGEGKTRWLVNKIIDLQSLMLTSTNSSTDPELVYVGSPGGYELLCHHYETVMNHKCPVKFCQLGNSIKKNAAFFTDELMRELPYISSEFYKLDGDWYITMEMRDFIN